MARHKQFPTTARFLKLHEDPIKGTTVITHQWCTQEFCSGGGVQQIQLRTERTGIWGR